MSIDKSILHILLLKQIIKYEAYRKQTYPYFSYDYGLQLLQDILYHDPTKDFTRIGSENNRRGLPSDKSLFYSPSGVGLPIGNLTSQLFANVYLHELDEYIKRELKIRYYGRYMDDFVLIHTDKAYLQSCIGLVQDFLSEKLHLTLHPKKIYFQHYTKGVPFCGAVIKPYRTYMQKKTLGRWKRKIIDISPDSVSTYEGLQKTIAMINSYLGMIKHHESYKIRKKILHTLPMFLQNKLVFKENYGKVVPRARRLYKSEIKQRKKRKYF